MTRCTKMESDQETFFDQLFRNQYGKIVGALVRKFGPKRLDLIETAIQEAFLKAIQLWPNKGNPDRPVNWLIQVAYRCALDHLTYQKRADEISEEVMETPADEPRSHFPDEVADDDLRMLFLCCHPALTTESQVALLLKTACGFSVPEIARAFLVKDETIAQRLVRAKQRLREQRIEFELPPAKHLAERLDTVLLSLYLLFNEGYAASEGEHLIRSELCEEAIYLAKKLASHPLGQVPSVYALTALMLFHQARIKTRTDRDGNILLLKDQDRTAWNQNLLREGAVYLSRSMRQAELSKYHLEAGIAACHVFAPSWEQTDWAQILGYYELLEERAPSPIVTLNRIAVTLTSQGPQRALAELEKAEKTLGDFEYYLRPALFAEIYSQLGEREKAKGYYAAALEVARTSAERRFLVRRIQSCRNDEM